VTIRSFFFWIHLVAGVCAGIIILIMSATGVLLTYERQILAWADSEYRSTVPPVRVPRRFTHTGDVLGLTGQTVAGLVSLGGVVLVWTGLALAWHRLAASVDLRTRDARASAKNHDYLKLPHSSISEP
jgi:uncharacterized iron-regulated membrane protein